VAAGLTSLALAGAGTVLARLDVAFGAERSQTTADTLGPFRSACLDLDAPVSQLAALLTATGPGVRGVLQTMASSPEVTLRWCGLRGLAALRDPAVVPAVRAAWRDHRAEAWRIARWAAYAAGGPDAASATFAPLVEDLGDPALAVAAGGDGARLLGDIDHPLARDRLMTELERPTSDAQLDAVIHALARQGEPRARARLAAIGTEAVATRSGNTTHEQARRMGAVAFYQLSLSADTLSEGVAMLRQLAQLDQEDTAAWAVQTLCERAVRRPAVAAEVDGQRRALAAELERLGLRWDHLTRGAFPCQRP
jgi:hypothetical protein